MVADHDGYIAKAPEDLRPLLVQLRRALASALPDADEIIAYNTPGFSVGAAVVAGYAAFSKQCGLYVRPAAIQSHADELAAAKLKFTKTGITFPPGRPPADDLVARLALASRRDLKV